MKGIPSNFFKTPYYRLAYARFVMARLALVTTSVIAEYYFNCKKAGFL
jgi:hypothetical protein